MASSPTPIDLRSDTVTRPTDAMLAAMRDATFGDDSRDGDATVLRLESLAASRTGKEAAVFVASGTMANLVAVLAHTQRGGEVLLDHAAHILNSEMGGIASIAGAFHRGIAGERGMMDLAALKRAFRGATAQSFGAALICMETTHNAAGGAVLPLSYMREVRDLAGQAHVGVHLDGARVFNAAVALRTDARTIASFADSVSFCVSKGLSAPIGSLLCGTRPFIERARRFRRAIGGNMRQAGPLAAAGIVAIESMIERLAEDHATAQRLAIGLHTIDPSLVTPASVETNIVRVELPSAAISAAEMSRVLAADGVLVSPCAKRALRFVTHRHITSTHIDEAIARFKRACRV